MNGDNLNSASTPVSADKQERLEELLEKNLALTEEIHKMTKSMKHYINFQKVMSVIYFVLIILPIIAGAILLPPLLKGIVEQYQSALGGEESGLGSGFLKATNPSDIRNISPGIKELLDY